jgi:hypothetical protein
VLVIHASRLKVPPPNEQTLKLILHSLLNYDETFSSKKSLVALKLYLSLATILKDPMRRDILDDLSHTIRVSINQTKSIDLIADFMHFAMRVRPEWFLHDSFHWVEPILSTNEGQEILKFLKEFSKHPLKDIFDIKQITMSVLDDLKE